MEPLEPHQRMMQLQCPECGDAKALTCKVTQTGEGIWVTLVHQFCECDPYGAWEDVWEQARDIVLEDEKFEYED